MCRSRPKEGSGQLFWIFQMLQFQKENVYIFLAINRGFLAIFWVLYSTIFNLPTSDSTVSEDAGIEHRTIAALRLLESTVRRSNHSDRSHQWWPCCRHVCGIPLPSYPPINTQWSWRPPSSLFYSGSRPSFTVWVGKERCARTIRLFM